MIRLSYIIPLFNCRDYISLCLDSILQQGLPSEEYEVIVINDGSTDQGELVVLSYCKQYGNFRLINQSHQGVAVARNKGIELARGVYIHFMDADDRLLPGGMKILIDNYVIPFGHPEIVSFWSHIVDRFYNNADWEVIRPHKLIYNGDVLHYGCQYGIGLSSCFCLISTDFLKKHQLRFSKYKIGEDMLFMLCIFRILDASIIATSLNIYRYVVRSTSAMNLLSKEYVIDVFHDFLELSNKICEIAKESVYPANIFMRDINICQRWAFTKLCAGDLSYKELKGYLHQAQERNFFFINECSTMINKFICHIYRYPIVTYVFALIYRNIFVSYIKPYIKRN